MIPGAHLLGFASAIIVATGYLPQILHLAKEHCSAGISIRAWFLWLVSSVLILLYALDALDVVLITIQSVNLMAVTSILGLARRYRFTCTRCASRVHTHG